VDIFEVIKQIIKDGSKQNRGNSDKREKKKGI
jgi:hypothetical protein